MANVEKYMCKTCQKVYKTAAAAGLSRHISQKHSSSLENKYYHKLERSKFDEIFKESVDSLAKEECYPQYIRDHFKTLVTDDISQIIIYMKGALFSAVKQRLLFSATIFFKLSFIDMLQKIPLFQFKF